MIYFSVPVLYHSLYTLNTITHLTSLWHRLLRLKFLTVFVPQL
jgi:hypothetical protein